MYRKSVGGISFSIHSPTHNQHAQLFISLTLENSIRHQSILFENVSPSKNIREYMGQQQNKTKFPVQNGNTTLPKERFGISYPHLFVLAGNKLSCFPRNEPKNFSPHTYSTIRTIST